MTSNTQLCPLLLCACIALSLWASCADDNAPLQPAPVSMQTSARPWTPHLGRDTGADVRDAEHADIEDDGTEQDTGSVDVAEDIAPDTPVLPACRDARFQIVARNTTRAPERIFTESMQAQPRDTIALNAQGTTFRDGTPVQRYEWSITDAPDGADRRLTPNAGVPDPSLFLDLTGVYQATVRVFDAYNVPSCDVGEFSILSTPRDEELHIQLVWTNDGSAGIDLSNDLDLHLKHERGTWNQAPYDCYWQNPQPDWGGVGSEDDPSLDVDDTDGFGPENIYVRRPSEEFYDIGVESYNIMGQGPTTATVRVWVRGVLRRTLLVEFDEIREMVHVARVWMEFGDVEEIQERSPSD